MKFVLLSFFLLILSACNLNQNIAIRGVDLHTHKVDGNTVVDLESIVSLGNLKLPNSKIPIKNPEQRDIGEVIIQQLDDGTNRIALSINYNESEKVNSELGKTLPNGREIPTTLGNEITLNGISILENSRIYIGGNPNESIYAGIALNVPAFDHILTKITSPLNLFMSFPFSEEIMGVAGIYSSHENKQNGLAIFAKTSQSGEDHVNLKHSLVNSSEMKKIDRITLFRLNYLFSKHATLRIK